MSVFWDLWSSGLQRPYHSPRRVSPRLRQLYSVAAAVFGGRPMVPASPKCGGLCWIWAFSGPLSGTLSLPHSAMTPLVLGLLFQLRLHIYQWHPRLSQGQASGALRDVLPKPVLAGKTLGTAQLFAGTRCSFDPLLEHSFLCADSEETFRI